jgi:hypothetical protein
MISEIPDPSEEKLSLRTLARLRAPIGGQEVELQQVDYRHGGLSLLRVRIREGKRFTVFDIDAETAQAWATAMDAWAREQRAAGGERP